MPSPTSLIQARLCLSPILQPLPDLLDILRLRVHGHVPLEINDRLRCLIKLHPQYPTIPDLRSQARIDDQDPLHRGQGPAIILCGNVDPFKVDHDPGQDLTLGDCGEEVRLDLDLAGIHLIQPTLALRFGQNGTSMKWIEDNLFLPRRVFYQEVAGKANPMERHPETPPHLQVNSRNGDGDSGPPVEDLIQK